MPDFGAVAVRAVEFVSDGSCSTPRSAWDRAAAELLDKQSAREKNCPRATFLSLCQEGLIAGVPRGQYTKAKENLEHAVEAIHLLIRDPSLVRSDPVTLWKSVIGDAGTGYDYQMHVVLALWTRRLIVHPTQSTL